MEFNIIGTYYGIFMIFLMAIIIVFNLIIGMKYKKLFDIMVKYPKLDSKMLAFKPFQNTYGFMPFVHPDYFIPILKRFFLLEAFSKTKTKDFYKKFYRYDLIEKIKDKDLRKNMDFILKYAPVRDVLWGLFFVSFVFIVIIGIIYSFSV